MRQEGILADSKDISAYLQDAGDSERKSQILLERFAKLEQYILNHIPDGTLRISYKQLNENAVNDGINTSKEKIFGHYSISSPSKDIRVRKRMRFII